MATPRDIKRRLRATKNMQQITRAMEAVSASKMRKSQLVAFSARPYAREALKLLWNVKEQGGYDHWLFREPEESKKTALLVVTSDKGLCGGYNASVLKIASRFLKDRRDIECVVVGERALKSLKKRGANIEGEFVGFGDYVLEEETAPVARLLLERFQKGTYREVWAVYTNFISTLKQEAVLHKVLPIDIGFIENIIKGIVPERGKYSENEEESKLGMTYEYTFEPSREALLEVLVPSLFEVAVHHIILEANASEHSARMIAMKNASENASDIMNGLSLLYNKARQATITKELLEVIAGREALEG